MIVVHDLDGGKHNWSFTGKLQNTRANISGLHKKANQLLIEIYPTIPMLQEVAIPVRRNETLYLDFYIPLLKKAIEVHGEQHYKFVAHYHNNAMGFMKHKKRDLDKQEWCSVNSIQYIELPFNETIEEWKDRIVKI